MVGDQADMANVINYINHPDVISYINHHDVISYINWPISVTSVFL